jgi:hypothetical protein
MIAHLYWMFLSELAIIRANVSSWFMVFLEFYDPLCIGLGLRQ